MIWLNAVRRWCGYPEKPPAISGEQSVLFVLQTKSPMTLFELGVETEISDDQLRPILVRLERSGRIRTGWAGPANSAHKTYSRI
jgi:hypothetical protein